MPSACGVQVITWGTNYQAGNGMLHFIDQIAFGGNSGHSALKITFPANSIGDAYINKINAHNHKSAIKIPYQKKTVQTKLKPSEDAYQETVYEIYWSWWPPKENGPDRFFLSENVNKDNTSERIGMHFEWNEEAKKKINTEIRKHMVTKGTPPSSVIKLPIATLNGLKINNMIDTMIALTNPATSFNLYINNCSDTCLKILEAGAQEAFQKSYFTNKAFGFFGNPQIVMNAALDFTSTIYNTPTLLQRAIHFTIIEKIGGLLIAILIKNNIPKFIKTMAMLGCMILSPFALMAFIIKKIATPLPSFLAGKNLLRYAYSSTSTLFKATAIFIVAPAMLMVLIPAALQQVIEKIQSLLITGYNKLHENIITSTTMNTAITSIDEMQTVEKNLNKSIQNSIKIVSELNTIKAIWAFEQILKNHTTVIPVFSQKTNHNILKKIQKGDKKLKEIYTILCNQAITRIQEIETKNSVNSVQPHRPTVIFSTAHQQAITHLVPTPTITPTETDFRPNKPDGA